MPDQKARHLSGRLLIIGAFIVFVYASISDLLRVLAQMGPHVGDIIAFHNSKGTGADITGRLPVLRTDGGTCVLDIAVLRAGIGSLVIEQHRPGQDRAFQVHWAGPRTTLDTDDCGKDADLQLKRSDIDTLRMAAGGMGFTAASL